MKLLLVNDEKMIAESIRRDVNWADCGIDEVALAFSANEAREQMQRIHPQVLIFDIEMPNEDGISLLRWVRSQEEYREAECVFLTCHANFDYAKEAVVLGCTDYILMPARSEEIERSVRKVVARILERQEGERLQAYGKQYISTIREEVKEEQNRGKKSKEDFVQEAEDYVRANLSREDLSVNDVAARLYLTPVYLSRIFKQERGMSIIQYIIDERMQLAKKLLEEGDLNSNAVAERVGYTSYPHFSTMFKKHFGYPPSHITTKK